MTENRPGASPWAREAALAAGAGEPDGAGGQGWIGSPLSPFGGAPGRGNEAPGELVAGLSAAPALLRGAPNEEPSPNDTAKNNNFSCGGHEVPLACDHEKRHFWKVDMKYLGRVCQIGVRRGGVSLVVAKHRFSTILDTDRHLFWSGSRCVDGDFSV